MRMNTYHSKSKSWTLMVAVVDPGAGDVPSVHGEVDGTTKQSRGKMFRLRLAKRNRWRCETVALIVSAMMKTSGHAVARGVVVDRVAETASEVMTAVENVRPGGVSQNPSRFPAEPPMMRVMTTRATRETHGIENRETCPPGTRRLM